MIINQSGARDLTQVGCFKRNLFIFPALILYFMISLSLACKTLMHGIWAQHASIVEPYWSSLRPLKNCGQLGLLFLQQKETQFSTIVWGLEGLCPVHASGISNYISMNICARRKDSLPPWVHWLWRYTKSPEHTFFAIKKKNKLPRNCWGNSY